ncbi:uncharacterized protein LOC142232149 [Haematobia irritans]|uniref:uncharacterized protein LOC142232149 n=1 Tax=Haematobia irritans TaxID=7368 RepID=UPI003F4F579E
MHGLMIFCFIGLAVAAPQGYEYPSPSSSSSTNFHNSALGQSYPLITKRFYIHSAPEEEDVEISHKDIIVGAPRKNYNVVFIKSVADKQQKAKIRIIPALNEDKTVIYVLTKKSEQAQIETHVEEPATTTSKPEVFFIKYKTNEEAEHAQRKIQAEYDHLGGSSIISDEGISPISSVIGSLDKPMSGSSNDHMSAAEGSIERNSASAPGTAYLPPMKKL